MFATISTVTEPENLLGKIKYNLLPPAIQSERIAVDGGSDFLHLRVPIIRGKIYWSHVRSCAGESCAALLTPAALKLKEPADLHPFASEGLQTQVTINSFFKLLTLLGAGQLLSECAVIDYPGTLAKRLQNLAGKCRTIQIITANPAKYRSFCKASLENYGCAVCVSDDITKVFDSPFVLFAHRAAVPTAFSSLSFVLSSFTENIYAGQVLTPEGISLPEKYLKLLPEGIGLMPFASALYELSGVNELSTSVCPSFRLNRRILTYKEVISSLTNNAT